MRENLRKSSDEEEIEYSVCGPRIRCETIEEVGHQAIDEEGGSSEGGDVDGVESVAMFPRRSLVR